MNEDSKIHRRICVYSVSPLFTAHLPCVPWSLCPAKRQADSWTLRPGSASGLEEESPVVLGPPVLPLLHSLHSLQEEPSVS